MGGIEQARRVARADGGEEEESEEGERGALGCFVLRCECKRKQKRESGDKRAVSKGEQEAENKQGRRIKKGRKGGNRQKGEDERRAGIKQGTGREGRHNKTKSEQQEV